MKPPRHKPLELYLALVALAGLAALVGLVLAGETNVYDRPHPDFWLFAALLLFGELMPIAGLRRARDRGVTVSTTFSFALLLSSGIGPAVIVQAVASLLDDVLRGKSALSTLFNVGQLTLSLSGAGALLWLLSDVTGASGPPYFSAEDVPAIVAAGGLLLLLNQGLSGTAFGLLERTAVLPYLRRYFTLHTPTAGMLLGLAPIAVVTADFSRALVPFLILPLVAIYEGRRQAALNEHQALHDSLTQLPNRVLFREQVQQACAEARRRGERAVVMLIDLDRFKDINDALGHHSGDLVLEQIRPRLRSVLRDSDMVARLGGDEFAILLPGGAGAEDGVRVAEKIREQMRRPFELRGLKLDVDASIGIACYPDHGDDVDVLMQRADVAMYLAKERKSGFEIYAREHDRNSPDRLALVGELRHAIEHDELTLFFQPKVELRSGDVTGVEALVRWRHTQHGLLLPAAFVPLAEQTGLMNGLTKLVLDQAVRHARVWREAGLELAVAVNLSAADLLDDDLPVALEALLAEHGVPARSLELEITEGTIMSDPLRAIATLDRLAAMGAGILIDDFGTGYSSLSYLKRLPVRAVKIDRAFVSDMAMNGNDATIVRSTIELGHSLGLEIVAEGVESTEIRDALREFGCDYAQGYLLGRPVPAEEIVALVVRSEGAIVAA